LSVRVRNGGPNIVELKNGNIYFNLIFTKRYAGRIQRKKEDDDDDEESDIDFYDADDDSQYIEFNKEGDLIARRKFNLQNTTDNKWAHFLDPAGNHLKFKSVDLVFEVVQQGIDESSEDDKKWKEKENGKKEKGNYCCKYSKIIVNNMKRRNKGERERKKEKEGTCCINQNPLPPFSFDLYLSRMYTRKKKFFYTKSYINDS